jgi:acetyl-CoA acetyltransferase
LCWAARRVTVAVDLSSHPFDLDTGLYQGSEDQTSSVDHKLGLVTLCIGGGKGIAMLLQRD